MLSIYPRNQSSCPAVAGAFFYVNLHLAQASAHTGEKNSIRLSRCGFSDPLYLVKGLKGTPRITSGACFAACPLYLVGGLPIILIFTGKEKSSH